jgi:hypothetical protein
MGASIYGYWPGASEEQQSGNPGFANDCHAYADWLTSMVSSRWLSWRLRRKGYAPLLSFHTIDTSDDHIEWTTPSELRQAARELRAGLLRGDPFMKGLVRLYRKGPGIQEPHIELAQDLQDVASIAEYAEQSGAKQITLTVGW